MIDKVPLEGWIIFNIVILGLLLLDLGVLNKRDHEVKMSEALKWTAGWISLALLFCAGIWLKMENGQTRALEFLTGYLIEYALSVDNIFVFVLIFAYFKVAPQYQHKVLFWGIMGALVMRAVMILAGVKLVARFEWLIYVFGVFLIFTGIKLALQKEGDIEPHENPLVRWFRASDACHRRLRKRALFRLARWQKMGNTAVYRAAHGRKHRPDFRH